VTKWKPWQFVVFLLAAASLAAFFELGRMHIESDNEGQRAAPPQEMLRSGDFLVPTLNGRTYLAKPPLLYWAIAAVYAATGVISEWTARIPTAVSGIVLVLCVYLIFRRKAGELAARWTAFALLASPYFLERTRRAELDVPLLLATFFALTAFYSACHAATLARRLGMAVAAGVALAAATLLKGPAPYLFLVAAFLAQCAVAGNTPHTALRLAAKWTAAIFALAILLWPLRLHFPVALVLLCLVWGILAWRYGGPAFRVGFPVFALTLAVGIALALPWLLAVLRREGWDVLYGLLQQEILQRTHSATDINSGTPFYYLLALPLMIAPWGFLLPLQLSRTCWENHPPIYRFSLVTGWLSLVLLSLVDGKEYEYLLPALPFLLLPAGFHLAEFAEDRLDAWMTGWLRIWRRICRILLPLGAAGLAITAVFRYPYPALLVETGCILGLVLVICLRPCGERADPLLRVGLASLLVICSGLLVTRSFHYLGTRSPKDLATLCGRLLDAGYTVEATKVYPAFTFYARIPIPETVDQAAIEARLSGKEPYFYLTRAQFLPMCSDLDALGARVLAGPCTMKGLVLVGNTEIDGLLPAESMNIR